MNKMMQTDKFFQDVFVVFWSSSNELDGRIGDCKRKDLLDYLETVKGVFGSLDGITVKHASLDLEGPAQEFADIPWQS